jgi:hypothetical protein
MVGEICIVYGSSVKSLSTKHAWNARFVFLVSAVQVLSSSYLCNPACSVAGVRKTGF